MEQFTAKLNGQDIVVELYEKLQGWTVEQLHENLVRGLADSPWRQKVQGISSYRLKFDVLKYEMIDGVLNVTAKGKNIALAKTLYISNGSGCNDLVQLYWDSI